MSFRPKFIFLTIVFATLLSVGITKAAWRDAPAGPPNYGAVSPDTQADYKPVNLGNTIQTKTGGLNIMGNVGIGTEAPSARLAVGDTGSPGDTIAAYANSSQSTLYAEQSGSGYAIYASGGLNYFSGNVGIGTVPLPAGEKLEVNGNIKLSSGVGGYGAGRVQAFSSGDVIGYTLNSATRVWDLISIVSSNPDYFAIRDSTAGASRLAIDENGNVGIGTANPGTYKLNVQGGQINSSGGLCIANNCITSWSDAVSGGGGIQGSGTQNYLARWVNFAGDSLGNSIIYDNGNNVGIGTTSPSAKLTVSGAGSNNYFTVEATDTTANTFSEMRLKSGSRSGYLWMMSEGSSNYGGDGALNVYSESGPLLFWTASTEKVRITGAGNVGIGTASPGTYKLNVQGGQINSSGGLCIANDCITSWSDAVSGGGGIQGSGTQNYLARWVNFAGDSLGNSIIYDNGNNVGIGTAAPGSYKLNVVGDIYTSGSGTAAGGWFVSSDARLKNNVETLSGALEKLGRARGVYYDLASGQGARQIGVIAQELEQEFPELVKTDDNGYKAVAYDRLSAVLIEAIKELKAQNQALQSRLDLLEKKW